MTSKPITTLDDVLDAALAKFCGECSEPLDPPGSQCGECGALPGETRAEAAERLAAEPHAIARAEAKRLREEAAQLLVSAEHVFRLADRVEYRSELRQQRDRLQARLGEAVSGHEQALAVLGEALAAEKAAAGPLADALRVHEKAARAEETARRLRKGAEAETEAAVRLSAAARVLARYQAESTAVARAREAAEAAAGQAAAAVRACEEDRDRAQALLERHAAVPLSRETVFALLFPALRMAYGSDADGRVLDQAERAMVGVFGDALRGAAFSEYAGALARADEERVRKQLREEFLTQPHLRQVGPGLLAAAWANAPKPSGGTPANAVVTPPPSVRPDNGFQGSPGLYQNPVAQ